MIFGVQGKLIVMQILNILLSSEEDAINTDGLRRSYSGIVVVSGRGGVFNLGDPQDIIHSAADCAMLHCISHPPLCRKIRLRNPGFTH